MVKDAVKVISIKGVVDEEAGEPEILANRFQSKRAMLNLPLAKNHKQVINLVWEKSKLDLLRLANGSAEARYDIVNEDHDKLSKPSKLDSLLKHELGQVD